MGLINFNGSEIQILNYLPARDKNDLIVITLQKSFENNIYNYYKLKMYFELHLVYLYTNIIFDSEDKADEEGLFDILKRSGLIDAVTEEIDYHEKASLWEDLIAIKNDMEHYHNGFAGFLANSLDEIEDKVKAGVKIMKELDLEETFKKYPQILQLLTKNTETDVVE